MGMFDSINIAATGLSAQRLRLDVISNNIANANTTRNANGDGPYRRDRVVMTPINQRNVWRSPVYPRGLETGMGRGVKIERIEKDMSDFRLMYDPSHPDAIQIGNMKGYVRLPNVNIVEEMTDMISASRSYEANAQVIMGSRQMFTRTLEISRSA
ncbi:MAG: flagellar basal body rod protein FlgC [Leptospiraceae bacterium]|nr:flagellar basal body rod protein FlgC [Leptospiraceae bacterium]MCB1315632.1 flagellar basal body rod protein FlgC [Leptospiraceae bacterium]MCB1319026.1 flagellar basal body rod protein FlgC [Leptospiraceae bacterium]